ncbi:MAG: acyl-CoA dehydrogenase family protein [Desulfatirhabdiaceae bacterium]
MDFKLNKEQEMLRKAVRDYARKELAPTAGERDTGKGFDRDIQFNRLSELDLTGIIFPETYGGAEADYVSYVVAIEELSRVCASTGVVLSAHVSMCSNPIFLFGSEEQKQRFLKPLAEGSKLGCLALIEPDAGSDIGAIQSTAVRNGTGWTLTGKKIFITNGGDADVTLAVFRTDEKASGDQGLSAFIIEKGTPGFSVGKTEDTLGFRSSSTRELLFSECRVPEENLLGKVGEGFKIVTQAMDGAKIGTAAQALGLAQSAYEEALSYSKQRYQFGRPICQFQTVEFKLADIATQVDAARFLVYRAAWCVDNRLPYTKEAAIAKLFASDVAMWAATEAVQLHGGNGYAKDYPVERLMRDAKVTQIYAGTNEIQRNVIGASILN